MCSNDPHTPPVTPVQQFGNVSAPSPTGIPYSHIPRLRPTLASQACIPPVIIASIVNPGTTTELSSNVLDNIFGTRFADLF